VTGSCEPWNGTRIGPGPVAFAAFPRAHPDSADGPLALAVAGSTEHAAVLLPIQIRLFIEVHADAELVCHDSAALHWLLVQHLRFQHANDTEAVATLWRYSRQARLIDVRLLDQLIRRFRGEAAPPSRSLADLFATYTEISLPAEAEVREQVAAALTRLSQTPDPCLLATLATLAATVTGLLRVHERLRGEAETVLRVVAATNRPAVVSTLSPAEREADLAACAEQLGPSAVAQLRSVFADEVGPDHGAEVAAPSGWGVLGVGLDHGAEVAAPSGWGVLGVGLDVMAVIVQGKPTAHGAGCDPARLGDIRRLSQQAYERAGDRLKGQKDVRGCFAWEGPRVAGDPQGLPVTQPHRLIGWLRKMPGQLADVYDCPMTVPETAPNQPCLEPEAWGALAAGDPALRAWRDLWRAARLRRWAEAGGVVESADAVVLRAGEWRPNLLTLRAMAGVITRPSPGHTFVVGSLLGLKVRCLAALAKARRYVPRKTESRHFGGLRDPAVSIAGRLHAAAAGRLSRARHAWRSAAACSAGPGAGAAQQADADAAKAAYSEVAREFRRLVGVTRGLLATLPLGLSWGAQWLILEQDHGVRDVDAAEVQRLSRRLVEDVLSDLRGYFEDDALDVLASGLGLPFNDIISLLPRQEHIETLAVRIRKELADPAKRGKLARALRRAESDGGGSPASGGNLAQRWLRRAGVTLGGHVIAPGYCAQTRRCEYEASVEEVRTLVAYELSAAGYPLVALFDEKFVVELPEAAARRRTQVARVGWVACTAARKLLGDLAPSCRLRRIRLYAGT
jgi:hypothetical protein